MKKVLFIPSVSLLVLFVFNSCKKTELPWQKCEYLSRNADTINIYLPGTWELVEYRSIGRGGQAAISTPETLGYTVYVTIDGDKISFKRFPGSSIDTYRFKIENEKDITGDPTDDFPVLRLYDINSGAPDHYYRIKICSNTLMFLQTYFSDLDPDITYKRIN